MDAEGIQQSEEARQRRVVRRGRTSHHRTCKVHLEAGVTEEWGGHLKEGDCQGPRRPAGREDEDEGERDGMTG